MPSDLLSELAALPGVMAAASDARAAVDALLWDRHIRSVAADLARQSVLRGAWANAAMDGAEVPFESLAAGQVEQSPMGERARRALALTTELPKLADIFANSPLQAWARMNTLLVAGLAPEDEVGRPRAAGEAEDPLRLGELPPAAEASVRLSDLADVVVAPTAAPAVVAAGLVHAELAVLRPFRYASGPLARATTRLVLASRGVDPDLLTIPEAGLFAMGRAKYVRAVRDYASGTPEGVASWLVWFARSVALGADQARQIGAELG